jgi:hypothetical protein
MSAGSNAKCAVGTGVVVLVSASVLFLAGGLSWRDDFQCYQLAGYWDAARAWRAGELPLLSPSSWNGGALLGEYQNAVFSPAVMVPVVVMAELGVPLSAAAAALAVGHLAILAAGCALLARQKRLPAELCLLVALVGTFNGYQLVWGALCWFPELASFTWVPWAWWALERSIRRPGALAWVPPALFLALILTAGWPFSVLMIAVVSVALVGRHRLWRRRWARLCGPGLGWAVGLGLSAPAWLALVEYVRWTIRGQGSFFTLQTDWLLSPRHLPALLFPGYRTPLDQEVGLSSYFNAEMVGGLVPVVILVVSRWTWGNWRFFGRFRTEAILAALACLLAMLPGLGPFRWSFRWLPLVFLAGGLAAAGALERLRSQARASGRANLGLWALVGVTAVWLYALVRGLDPTAFTLWLGAAMMALCLTWGVVERFCPLLAGPRRWAPAVVTWAVAMLFALGMPPLLSTPAWPISRAELERVPLEPGIRYWSVYTWKDMAHQDGSTPVRSAQGRGVALLPANLAMYTGADVVQGYSPQGPLGLGVLFRLGPYGQLDPQDAEQILREEAGPGGLLELMAVDGLLIGETLDGLAAIVQAHGWRAEPAVGGAWRFRRPGPPSPRVRCLARALVNGDRNRVLERLVERSGGALPMVLYRGSAGADIQADELAMVAVESISEQRNRVVVEVGPAEDEQRDSVVVFSRAWYPGYRAWLDGEPMPVEVLGLTLPAVRLPPGARGTLVLEYRPLALTLGGPVAALSAVFVLGAVLYRLVAWSRRRGGSRCARDGCAGREGRQRWGSSRQVGKGETAQVCLEHSFRSTPPVNPLNEHAERQGLPDRRRRVRAKQHNDCLWLVRRFVARSFSGSHRLREGLHGGLLQPDAVVPGQEEKQSKGADRQDTRAPVGQTGGPPNERQREKPGRPLP